MNKGRKKRGVYDGEIARTALVLKRLPIEIIREMTASQLIRAFEIKLARNTVEPIRKQVLEARKKTSDPFAIRAELVNQITLELLARIVTKTYAHKGDEEEIGSEEAMRLIHRILKRHDPAILTRNEKRRIPNVPVASPLTERIGGRESEARSQMSEVRRGEN